MLPILLTTDMKEVAKRERYKQIEEERRGRIFNAKKRQIGIDYEALQYQMMEKKEREKAEKEEGIKYLIKQNHDFTILNNLESKIAQDKRKIQQQIDEYRRLNQKFQDRREFDLNDPDRFKKERVTESDESKLGPSSMQSFEGQEELNPMRKQILAEQQQTWLLQQMLEKEQAKRDFKLADDIYEETVRVQGQRYVAMKKMEEECQRKLDVAIMEYNKALSVKKLRSQMEEMRLDMEDSLTHKINQITSDMLSEDRNNQQSALGPGRLSATNFKGMSDEELAEIKRIQQLQILEKQARKREEAMREKYYEDFQNNLNITVDAIDTKNEKIASDKDGAVRLENKRLMEEQKARQRYLNEYVYQNFPTEEYFAQFNTTTR